MRMFVRYVCFYIRCLIYKPFFSLIRKTYVPLNSLIEKTSIINRSSIGNYCYIGPYTVLNKVSIGNYCSIGPGVQIGGTEHLWWHGSTSFRLSNVESPHIETIIEDDVWIAANVARVWQN